MGPVKMAEVVVDEKENDYVVLQVMDQEVVEVLPPKQPEPEQVVVVVGV